MCRLYDEKIRTIDGESKLLAPVRDRSWNNIIKAHKLCHSQHSPHYQKTNQVSYIPFRSIAYVLRITATAIITSANSKL